MPRIPIALVIIRMDGLPEMMSKSKPCAHPGRCLSAFAALSLPLNRHCTGTQICFGLCAVLVLRTVLNPTGDQ